jgi:hypothetical protein
MVIKNMNSEGLNKEEFPGKWNVDLGWFQDNNCSFLTLAQDHLCSKCRRRLKKETRPEDVIKTISTCCSKKDNFINADMSILSSVFRYFLANGNRPVEMNTLSRELAEKRGSVAGTSPEVLYRLLSTEKYYGIKNVDVR